VRIDGSRVVARIHQVFFNASYQGQDCLLLVPEPGKKGKVSLSFRTPAQATPPSSRSLDTQGAQEQIQTWTLIGGNPGPLARYPGPTRIFGPFFLGRGAYLKIDWRFEFLLPGGAHSIRKLAMAPGGRPVKPLSTNALEIDLPAAFRSHAYSPTHRLLQKEGEKGRVVFNPVSERLPADSPFLLLWPGHPGQVGLLRGQAPDGTPLGLMLIPPDPSPPVPKQRCWVVALDTGGSLFGKPFQENVARIESILNLLGEQDLFDLVPFSVFPQPFHRSPIAATPANKQRALEFLRNRQPRGAVNFESAILTCLEIAREVDSNLDRAVLLLTDGRPTLGEVHARAILGQKAIRKIPLFPVASGPDTDYYFLEQLARVSGGASVFHETEEDPIPLIRARVRPSREEEWGQILIQGAPLETPPEFRYDGPRVVTFAYQGDPKVHVHGKILHPSQAQDHGILPHLIDRARKLGGSIWRSLSGEGNFPGGALSFRLLGLVPGTPRPRILHTIRDGIGPLGRARMLALQGLLDQGTYQPVAPGPQRAWSGNRFFLQDSEHRWVESGLSLEKAIRIDYGSAAHSRLTTHPRVRAHLGLARSLALFTPQGPTLIRPREQK
jgi:hypothetical protein